MIATLNGNALRIPLADESVQCVITSPPYWGLRDYNTIGQLGLESTPEEYIANMVAVFREVWRVLRPDGTLWLNMGDCYAGAPNGRKADETKAIGKDDRTFRDKPFSTISKSKRIERGAGRWGGGNNHVAELKPKDLIGMPWRIALALQADGWWLRSDIIWSKPNPMPESVTDRPTKSHEYVFLLTKSQTYYYDAEAIKEPIQESSIERAKYGWNGRMIFDENGRETYRSQPDPVEAMGDRWSPPNGRNKRTVWNVATEPYSEAHFATFPRKLVEPMILSGSRPDDIVLDPFAGTATVGKVCIQHQRQFIGVELNQKYIELQHKRMDKTQIGMCL